MKAFEKLIVRAQVIKLGPDQILLAFAIAWIAKYALKLNTQLELVALEGADSSRMANYEGVLLQMDDAEFANSEVHECLRLPEVAKLLQGPLGDLALGSGTGVRQEFLAHYDVLMEQAGVLFRQGKTEDSDSYIDPSVFVHASMVFHRWLMGLVSERLKTHSLAAWIA
jgi:hypothetical protein